jgi:hypothetical protein
MRDDDRYAPVDISDIVDTDAADWLDDRTRLLTDGRTVRPNTLDDEMAAIRAARQAEAKRWAHLEGVREDWTHGDRWGAA